MQSIIQIIKLNDPKPWTMEGRSGVSHSAECILLKPDGSPDQVGVLKIRGEELIKKAQVGIYTVTFAMRANPASRQLEAVVVDLQQLKASGAGFVPADSKPATPAKA